MYEEEKEEDEAPVEVESEVNAFWRSSGLEKTFGLDGDG